jgi:polysaccharide export outer membrane protein
MRCAVYERAGWWRRAGVARVALLMAGVLATAAASAGPLVSTPQNFAYVLQPGDVLAISVWKEPDLQAEVLVRPDGGISFPLAGDILVKESTIQDVQLEVTERLKKYIPDPVVTVALKLLVGNRIYLVGKVNRPGEFSYSKPLDVMQALSLAGGTTPYASLNDILVLRRLPSGDRVSLQFRYGEVERGVNLDQNMDLDAADYRVGIPLTYERDRWQAKLASCATFSAG